MNITPTVKQLLILNVIFYIGSQIVGAPAYDLLSMYFPGNPGFHFWQPITHMFMHAAYPQIMHILFNMIALYSFGSALEHYWGAKKFLFFYFSCGLGAALLHIGVSYYFYETGLHYMQHMGLSSQIHSFLATGQLSSVGVQHIDTDILKSMFDSYNSPVLGASGAIYGLLVAFAFMFPNAALFLIFIPIPIKAKYFVPVLLAYDLISGIGGQSLFGGDGIAHFAHLGGAIVGFLMMWYWKNKQFNHNRWN